jgi:hypothetical protein
MPHGTWCVAARLPARFRLPIASQAAVAFGTGRIIQVRTQRSGRWWRRVAVTQEGRQSRNSGKLPELITSARDHFPACRSPLLSDSCIAVSAPAAVNRQRQASCSCCCLVLIIPRSRVHDPRFPARSVIPGDAPHPLSTSLFPCRTFCPILTYGQRKADPPIAH